MNSTGKLKDVSIVLCGAAGQGIATMEDLLTKTMKNSGYHVFSTREYMSRVRGGVNSTSIRISSNPVRAFINRIDLLIPLSADAIPHLIERIDSNTLILGDEKFFLDSENFPKYAKKHVPFGKISEEIGGKIYSNIISLGVICGLLKANVDVLHSTLNNTFSSKGQKIADNNLLATNKGLEIAADIKKDELIAGKFDISKEKAVENHLIVDGREAIGLGAIAGGANFVTFYPMAPSTGIGTFLAQNGFQFSMIVDQSEDEISVINKALGASYAGARSFVSTAGGGFSLMIEGLSFAGQAEIPIVIHIGQRPGPATGMPTRTDQGDIEQILYAGSGEFPRIIFAPGSIEDAFWLTQNAFNLAAKYQVPVFILSDQYLVDSYYNLESLDLKKINIDKYIIETDENYVRYKYTENGISPRGVPGYGNGLTDCDSHTHTEYGDITEDPRIRMLSVEKRFKKLTELKKVVLEPEFIGNKDYKTLIISWGSTYHIIKEALEILGESDIAFLHFKQIYPINPNISKYLEMAEKTVIIEQNYSGHFAKLVKLETGKDFDIRILKYSGYCFSVEEIVNNLKDSLEV